MNKLPLAAVLAVGFVSGCIYDNQCDRYGDDEYGEDGYGGGPGDAGGGGPGDAGGGDTGAGDEHAITPEFWLTPNEALPGDTIIVSLESDDDTVEFAAVEDLFFTGGVRICTTSARPGELLITLYVEESAELGPIDLVVDFGGADRFFVEDAFFVVDEDGSTGGTGGGGSGGGGSDGGGSGGGTTGGGGSTGDGACG